MKAALLEKSCRLVEVFSGACARQCVEAARAGAALCFGAGKQVHRDQSGAMSIVAVFALLLLTMLLGMVWNVARQADGKIRMQNAADAAAYSGGVILARGMNTLAFTNHLLFDTFAMTAFMREARDQNAQSYVPQILAAWSRIGPVLASSQFAKFQALGTAITQKVPLEQQMVTAYGTWAAAVSQRVLPVLEDILRQETIPNYQRAVVWAFPQIAQMATLEVARRHGEPAHGRGPMLGALWRATGEIVGGDAELYNPSLPVVEPLPGVEEGDNHFTRARQQRRTYATHYLNDWNNQTMVAFEREGKMSQFAALWRSFTCGQLEKLLEEEYPDRNLPFQIRTRRSEIIDANEHLERHYMFVAVVYWQRVPETAPTVFRNPLEPGTWNTAFAQVQLFVPTARLEWQWIREGGGGSSSIPIGGVPGDFPTLPADEPPGPQGGGGPGRWVVGRQHVSTAWDLLNQSWNCQLVPATAPALAEILQTPPPLPAFQGLDVRLPSLGGATSRDIGKINMH